MRLSELTTGEKGVIVKVLGHGGFRKRIVEMGFIKGKTVEVLLNAPLKDPIKYKVLGYEISLRRQEAEMIEVVSEEEAKNFIIYLKTKFFRSLVLSIKISQHAPSKTYRFVPMQDFTKPWTDAELYKKYSLTDEEIAFIESMIKPM